MGTSINGAEEVIIIGAGGFGREVLQYASDVATFRIKGFLDDSDPLDLDLSHGLPILGTVSGYLPQPSDAFLLAVGEPQTRARIARRFQSLGGRFETVIHPKAYVAGSATIGAGSIVAPFASVGSSAKLGEFSLVHLYASVAHDAFVGRFSAISPYAAVNGGGRLGEAVFLGARSTINPSRTVGECSKVPAGSVVYQDVPSWSLAAGNPAKSRKLMRTEGAGVREVTPDALYGVLT